MSRFKLDAPARYWRRSRGRRLLLLEAAVHLVWAGVVVRWVRFRRLAPRLGRFMGQSPLQSRPWPGDPEGERVRDLAAALRAVADQVPWRPSCLVMALAGHRMLRRRGLPSTLYFGVNLEGGALQAHAWLRCGALNVSGHEAAPAFQLIGWFEWRPDHGG